MDINTNDLNGNSLIMHWNTDVNGNPASVKIEREIQQVSTTHFAIQLAQIPDKYYRVKVVTERIELSEVFNKRDINPSTFLVDYGNGLVYFHPSLAGELVMSEYYGRGVILLSDTRIFHKTGENFISTLDEVLEGGKDALALLEATGGLNGAIKLLDEKAEEGTAVAERIESFIEETEFYGYTIVLSREAFVVKSNEQGDVERSEINAVYSDVVVYKGAVQITPTVSIYSSTNCTFTVDGQSIKLQDIDKNSVKAQATIQIDCGDGLVATRVLEITKVFDGVTPYQVEMTNTFYSFNADADGKLQQKQYVTCDFSVTKGGEEYRGYEVFIQNMPDGLLHNMPVDTRNLQSITFTATTGATLPDNGAVILQFQLDNDTVINKSFVYGKTKQGITAQFLSLVGNQVIRYNTPDYSDVPTPSRCTINAISSGLSGTPIWSVKNGESWDILNSNSTTLTFYPTDTTIWGDRLETTIRCELDGMVDEISLFKIASGAEGYTVMLTNESSIVQTSEDGTVPDSEIEKQTTAVVVYRGDKELSPDSITLTENGAYTALVTGGQIKLTSISNSIDTVVIPITVVVEGRTFEKQWTIAKSLRGATGNVGSVYILNIEDGTRSITYNQVNQNPRPTKSATFMAKLYKDGQDVTAQVPSWYWYTTGHMVGNSTNYMFTPNILSSFDDTKLNNSVTVEAVFEGHRISYTVPIAITKDAGGIDWVEDWDSTKVSIRDMAVLTPKIFAGTYDEDLDLVTGVAIGTDVINDNETIGIVAYQNNKTSFILDADGSLMIGNPFDDEGVGISYNDGELILSVKDLSIAGETVPTWNEMEESISLANKDLLHAIQENINEMNSSLDNMASYVDTILQDNLVDEVEKARLDSLFNAVSQEVNSVQGQYNSVINNPYLVDAQEVANLQRCYRNYMMAYDNILAVYNNVFGESTVVEIEEENLDNEYVESVDFYVDTVAEILDGEDEFEEEPQSEPSPFPINGEGRELEEFDEYLVDSDFVYDSKDGVNEVALDELATLDGFFLVTMDGEVITMVTEDTLLDFEDAVNVLREYGIALYEAINNALLSISKGQSQDLINIAKEEIRLEITDVDNALSNLENTMNGEFKTGLIGLQNRTILEERLRQLEVEKSDVDGQYRVLYSNTALSADDKDKLGLAKSNLDTAHDILVAKINQSIADNLLTDREIEAVNALISDYASYLQIYSGVAQECNVTITINTANLAVESITDEDVFNKVTNYGATQGLFIKNDKVYINSEYINTRNFKAQTDDGKETFKIDENGEVSITAKTLSITGQSNLATQDYVNTQIENITNTNVTFTLSNEFQIIPTDESYYPLSEGTYVIDVKGYLGSAEEITDFLIGSVKSTAGIIAVVSNTNKTVIFSVTPDATLDDTSGYMDIPITYGGRQYNKRWSWAVSKQGNQATYVTITGEQFFKYTNNYTGVPVPSSITLTANVFNSTELGKWQYFDENSKVWIDWIKNDSVVTNKELTMTPTDATLPSLLRVLVRYYVDSVFDTYTVTCISDGANGTNGINGTSGKDGTSYYFYVRYSANANGYPMTLEPQEDTKYMGTYSGTLSTAPSTYGSYTWSLIKGEDGQDGTKGEDGEDGLTSYLHIKYSDNGESFTSNNGETVGKWIGTYVDFVKDDSNTFSDYTWKKFVGEDGQNGQNGSNAQYIMVTGEQVFKYTDNYSGTPTPQNITLSTTLYNINNATYQWSYRQSGSTSWTNINGATSSKYTLAHNNSSIFVNDSKSVSIRCVVNSSLSDEITVVKVTDGTSGKDGQDGQDGKSVIAINEKYYSSTSQQTLINGKWEDSAPTWTNGTYIWTKTIFTYSDNSTIETTPICVTGKDGADGLNGGVSVSSVDIFYYKSTSSTTTTGGEWSTNAPTWENGKYIWSKTITYLDNNTSYESNAVCITGQKGVDGDKGDKGDKGEDAYTVLLTNENHSFMADSNGNITSSDTTTTTVVAFKGATPVTPTVGTLPTISGLTITKSGATITVKSNTGTSLAMSGSFNIPVTVDGKSFTKTFSWSKALAGKKGEDGASGSDAYTVILSNENHAFVANHLGVIAEQIIETSVVAYKGTTTATPTIGALPSVKGLTLAVSGSKVTIKANKGSELADSGSFNIPITVDGKVFTKAFSWTKVKDGNSGADGESAKNISLTASSQVFKSTDGGTSFTPNEITITAFLQNLDIGSWAISIDGGVNWDLIGSYSGITVNGDTIKINKDSNAFSDTVTSIAVMIADSTYEFYDIMTITKLHDMANVDFEGIAEEVAKEQIDDFDKRLNQQAVFNRLTNNGQSQGLYLDDDGQLYINGEYIEANTIRVEHLEVGSITMLVDGIVKEEVKTEVGNITVGGENLIRNSNFSYGFVGWQGDDLPIYYITQDNMLGYYNGNPNATAHHIYTEPISVRDIVSQDVTFTFEYIINDTYALSTSNIATIAFFSDEITTNISKAVEKYNIYYSSSYVDGTKAKTTLTMQVPLGAKYARVYAVGSNKVGSGASSAVLKTVVTTSGETVVTRSGNTMVATVAQNLEVTDSILWGNFQLEIGNKATSWKPSSQDSIIHTNQSTDDVRNELGNLSDIVSTNNGADALTAQLKLTLLSDFRNATSLYDSLIKMYNSLSVSSLASLKNDLSMSYLTLESSILIMQQTISTTDEEGLSSILALFNNFYAMADLFNESITEALKGMNDSVSNNLSNLSNSVTNQITSINGEISSIMTRFTFADDGLTIKSTTNATKHIKLDNDSLDFIDGGSMVAQITDQQLSISNAKVDNQMKIGNITIKPSGMGGIIFVYE